MVLRGKASNMLQRDGGLDAGAQQQQQQVGQSYGYGNNAQGFDIAQESQRRRNAIQPMLHICRRDLARCTFVSGNAEDYVVHMHQVHGEPVSRACYCRICSAARVSTRRRSSSSPQLVPPHPMRTSTGLLSIPSGLHRSLGSSSNPTTTTWPHHQLPPQATSTG
ncbi:hypothetical protein EJ03DRAFT_154816 [Teratosphaeria nubilosa]|uniref:Uncharacterized protein n=1 Tax=Teratosphaeria nubilosa TaxID=161662 RepID=A0A6G1LJV2_9PEZI|nr:hypothetical protein EJ03DRAFT_154816 [Teratosphaeria nubilosa]